MDKREAFRKAAATIHQRNWDPAFLDQPQFQNDKGEYLTIRQVCEWVGDLTEPLDEQLKEHLYPIFHRASDQDLAAELRVSEKYSTAAACLSKFVDRRLKERKT